MSIKMQEWFWLILAFTIILITVFSFGFFSKRKGVITSGFYSKNSDQNQTEQYKEEATALNNLKLEYATTPEERSIGLMRRTELCQNCGMLFTFEKPQKLSFWMKNTLIPLDIIFINQDGEIINITEAVAEPEDKDDEDYPLYASNQDAMYVIEVNKGFSVKNNIKIGQKVNLSQISKKQ